MKAAIGKQLDSTTPKVTGFTARSWSNPEQLADLVSEKTHPGFAKCDRTGETVDDVMKATVESLSAREKQHLAKQLGYDSVGELLASSTVVTLTDGSAWCLTIDRSGTWAAWNIYSINSPQDTLPKDDAAAARSGAVS